MPNPPPPEISRERLDIAVGKLFAAVVQRPDDKDGSWLKWCNEQAATIHTYADSLEAELKIADDGLLAAHLDGFQKGKAARYMRQDTDLREMEAWIGDLLGDDPSYMATAAAANISHQLREMEKRMLRAEIEILDSARDYEGLDDHDLAELKAKRARLAELEAEPLPKWKGLGEDGA